jgi:predicted ATPase
VRRRPPCRGAAIDASASIERTIQQMPLRLQVRNYRGLRAVDWSPEGVCALVGANGSGKTTLLDVPALLGDALDRGLARALEQHGGIANARNMRAREDEPYYFEIAIDDLAWRLAPVQTDNGFRPEERLSRGSARLITREAGSDNATIWDKVEPARDVLALGIAAKDREEVSPLAETLTRYRLYGQYDIAALRRSGSPESSERRLDRRGTNVFSVLRNWRDKKADRERYELVIEGLRDMFPDFFDDLDFAKAAQVVSVDLHLRGSGVHSASLAPDGWFVALLHLTALASTHAGDVIAIDEPENALHPFAIKVLLERMRTWSGRRSVTVLLATHSPVIINAFDDCPEQLFVMEPDQQVCPVAVTDLKDRDWLAHFALGDLYMREEFGAPRHDDEHRADHHR